MAPDGGNEEAKKAALILMMIKSDVAGKLLRSLSREERREISKAMSLLGAVSSDHFNETLEDAISRLRGTSNVVGNNLKTRDFLANVLSEDETNEIMASIEWTIWDKLSRVDPDVLVDYFSKEHVQIVAVILSHMKPEAISKVISKLPEDSAEDLMKRLTDMTDVDPELIKIIEDSIHLDWDAISGKSDIGKLVLNVFDNFDQDNEQKFLKIVEQHDESLADTIKKEMFSFDDLSKLGDKAVQDLLREINKDKLMLAMKGASEELKSLVYQNMSERAARIMKSDMDAMGPVRITEVDSAQNHIAKVAKRLIREGVIVFGDDML